MKTFFKKRENLFAHEKVLAQDKGGEKHFLFFFFSKKKERLIKRTFFVFFVIFYSNQDTQTDFSKH